MAFITYEPAQCMLEPVMPYTNIEGADQPVFLHVLVDHECHKFLP